MRRGTGTIFIKQWLMLCIRKRELPEELARELTTNWPEKLERRKLLVFTKKDKYDSSKIDKSKWDHALFVAFAPADKPQIALGLIVENGEHGSRTAAPIARRVIDTYLSDYQRNNLSNAASRLAKYSHNTSEDN